MVPNVPGDPAAATAVRAAPPSVPAYPPAAAVPLPRVPAAVRPATAADLPFIDALQKRHARMVGRTELLRLAVSARTPEDLPYADELLAAGATVAFSRFGVPDGRAAGRLRDADLTPLVGPEHTAFVCGSSGFAEAASRLLVDLGVAADRIRVERFGPSGV